MTLLDQLEALRAHSSGPRDHVLDALLQEMTQSAPTRALSEETAARQAQTAGPQQQGGASRVKRAVWSGMILVGCLLLTNPSAWKNAPLLILLSSGAGLIVGLLLVVGLIPGRMGLLLQGPRRGLVLLTVLAAFTGLSLQASNFDSVARFLSGQSLRQAAGCFAHAHVSGAVALGLLLWVWRRTDPFSPGLTGAWLGLIAGLAGTLGVELSCANSEGLHLTVAHGASCVILAGAGYLVGRKWLTP